MRKLMLALVAMLGIAATSQAAIITVYSGNAQQAAFNAAAGTLTLEDFADATLVPGLSFVAPLGNGSISGGVYNDVVDLPPTGNNQVTFGFIPSIRAFGGNFDLTPGGAGIGIEFLVTFDDNTTQIVSTQVPNSFSGQFFGFISDTSIKSVQLYGGTQGTGQETFTLDNLVFASSVPEPISMIVFGSLVVGGIVAVRRRMSKVAA